MIAHLLQCLFFVVAFLGAPLLLAYVVMLWRQPRSDSFSQRIIFDKKMVSRLETTRLRDYYQQWCKLVIAPVLLIFSVGTVAWKSAGDPLTAEPVVRWWRVLGALFDYHTRARVYTPCVVEMTEDLARLWAEDLTPNQRRFARIALLFRTVTIVIRCLWITVFSPLIKAIPAPVRRWWAQYLF